MSENPFLYIVPKEEEKLIEFEGINVENIAKEVERGGIILIVGEHGSGKSQLIRELIKRTQGKLLDFTSNILNEIKDTNENIVYIEDFDLINGFDVEKQKRIISLISDKSEMGTTFVIECTPKIAEKLKFKNEREIKIPKLTLNTARELVIEKLNSVREEKSKDISPFTEKDIEEAWKKSGGNPRMLLMLLSMIYDLKVNR